MVKAKAVIFESDSLDEAARTFVEYGLDGMVVCRCSEEIVGVVAVKD
ncbi:CBS domain-containing protein, partial [Geobacillus sp. ZGt-1]